MEHLISQLCRIMPTAITGSVVRTEGAAAAVAGFPAPVGSLAEIERQSGAAIRGEVVGFRDHLTLVYPLGEVTGIRYGNRVRLLRSSRFIRVGNELLGRVIDAHGQTIDGAPEPLLAQRALMNRCAPPVFDRTPITKPLTTGIRCIDGLLPCGRGQRVGIFSGAGVGKSSLLGMLARHSEADVNVVALIGERGREVKEYIDHHLGPEGLSKSVVVVATSDEPALLRRQAATTATVIAEYFRDQGRNVLLLMDSLTRFATAEREIAMAAGEIPAARGYPASVFSSLPRLLERAGPGVQGAITAFYAVLVEGDDLNEPISDAVRSLVDGHIVLSRRQAAAGNFPAIDLLESISRVVPQIADQDQRSAIAGVRSLLAAYRENEDLISVGAYRPGTNPQVDTALRMRGAIQQYMRQNVDQTSSAVSTRDGLRELVQQIESPGTTH